MFLAVTSIAVLVLAVVPGCSNLTSEVGGQLPPRSEHILVGTSRLKDVLGEVGPPSRVTATASGFAMLYERNLVEEKQLGFNFNVPVLRLFKFVGAKSWLEHESRIITFDTNGVVQGWGQECWRKVLGTGGGAQLLVTVASLVDSTQVRRPAPQHEWGRAWLAPLPQTLNTASSLDQGTFGFEQTLAPSGVGQRSLEMTPAPRKSPKKK